MNKSVFEFTSYIEFLQAWIQEQPRGGHGIRLKLAQLIQKQSVFISQVLHGDINLSLSQAKKIAEWIELSAKELDYFLLLVQIARADGNEIKDYFEKQASELKQKNLHLKERFASAAKEIEEEIRVRYYSTWYFAAVRLLTAIPAYQSKQEISQRLQLPLAATEEILDFLETNGLVNRTSGKYAISSKDLFLGNDSPLISRHHANWRLRALTALDREQKDELHYSTAVVISTADAEKIKRILVRAIEEKRNAVKASGNEELFCVNVDFFKV